MTGVTDWLTAVDLLELAGPLRGELHAAGMAAGRTALSLVVPAKSHITDRRQAVAEGLQIRSLLRLKLRRQANRVAVAHAAHRQRRDEHQKCRTHHKRFHHTPRFFVGGTIPKRF